MELAMVLVDRGADIHVGDDGETTLYMAACYGGNMELVMALLNMGANIHARDEFQGHS